MENLSKYPNHYDADEWAGEIDNIKMRWSARGQAELEGKAAQLEISTNFLKAVVEHITTHAAKQEGWVRVKIRTDTPIAVDSGRKLWDFEYFTVQARKADQGAKSYRLVLEGLGPLESDLNNISVKRILG